MESFQKRERDRRKLLKRREKADRRKERSQAQADRNAGIPPASPSIDSPSTEVQDAVRVAPPGSSSPGATP